MMADVTNTARSARGLQLADGSTRFVDPGETARLDLADHPLHRAWEAAGEMAIVPLPDRTKATPDERLSASRPRDRMDRRPRAR